MHRQAAAAKVLHHATRDTIAKAQAKLLMDSSAKAAAAAKTTADAAQKELAAVRLRHIESPEWVTAVFQASAAEMATKAASEKETEAVKKLQSAYDTAKVCQARC